MLEREAIWMWKWLPLFNEIFILAECRPNTPPLGADYLDAGRYLTDLAISETNGCVRIGGNFYTQKE